MAKKYVYSCIDRANITGTVDAVEENTPFITDKFVNLSSRYDRRFVIVDEETENVLDDAQGYGYKSKQKAMAAWSYKNRDKSKDAEKRKKQRIIKDWLKEHPVVGDALEEAAWNIVKRNVPPETKIDTKLIKSILKENNLELEGFSARDLLRVV